jgi:hypothetical protein
MAEEKAPFVGIRSGEGLNFVEYVRIGYAAMTNCCGSLQKEFSPIQPQSLFGDIQRGRMKFSVSPFWGI